MSLHAVLYSQIKDPFLMPVFLALCSLNNAAWLPTRGLSLQFVYNYNSDVIFNVIYSSDQKLSTQVASEALLVPLSYNLNTRYCLQIQILPNYNNTNQSSYVSFSLTLSKQSCYYSLHFALWFLFVREKKAKIAYFREMLQCFWLFETKPIQLIIKTADWWCLSSGGNYILPQTPSSIRAWQKSLMFLLMGSNQTVFHGTTCWVWALLHWLDPSIQRGKVTALFE